MYPSQDLLQLLQIYTVNPSSIEESSCLEFPLEELLYAVLADHAELRNSFYSLNSLPQLVEEYRSMHLDCTFTPESLLSEGWLSPFMDRWDFNIWPHKENTEEGLPPYMQREPAAFLRWLTDRQKDCGYEIFVPQFSQTLRRFRAAFPHMPTLSWLIHRGYLSPNGNYLSSSHRGERSAEAGALARLWSRSSRFTDGDQAGIDLWLDLAMALDAMNGAFELLPYEQQRLLLSRIITRLEMGRYPDVSEENRRILRLEAWCRRPEEVDANWTPLTGDLILDLRRFDHYGYAWDQTLIQRRRIVHSYVWLLCRHLHFLNNELFIRAVNIISDIAKIGCLNGFSLPAESLFRLWSAPQTSLLACDLMFFRSISKPKLQDDLFASTLHQITEQVLLQPSRPRANGKELTRLLLFFARQPKGGRVGEVGNKALSQLLTDLKRRRQELEPQLKEIAQELGQRMDRADDGLDWYSSFRLACMLTQELYYDHGSLPVAREASSCKALRQVLFIQYVRFLQSNTEFLKVSCGLLDLEFFSHAFWNDIYQENRTLPQEQGMLQWPSGILSAQTSSDQVSARYQCVVHLILLTTLMQHRTEPDPVLEFSFAAFLTNTLLPKHELLDYDTITTFNALSYMEATISLVDVGQDCFFDFFQGLNSYDLPELILVYHAAQDDSLRKQCLSLIENRVDAENPAPRLLAENSLIHLILDARIECLYPVAEQMLSRQLNHWEKSPGIAFQQEKNWTVAQLNQVWLNQKDYNRILEQGDPFYRAIALMESPEHRDLQQAEFLWKQLLKNQFQPACVINLIYTYSLQYEQETQHGGREKESLQNILSQVTKLRQRIENGPYADWTADAKDKYAVNLYVLYRQSVQDQTKLIQSLCKELGVSADLFAELNAKELKETEAEPVEIPSESPVPALRTFCTAALDQKAKWFFQVKSCDSAAAPRRSLLIWCVMNVCSHLMAYGPQLVVNKSLSEDRCTQLFRELFNQAYPEMFTLEVNDQEQTGHTASQVSHGQTGIAEVDLTFKNNGVIVAIGEALRLYTLQKKQIGKHIYKLLGNNNLDVPMFLLVYSKSSSPEDLWQSYCTYLQDEFIPAFKDRYWGPAAVSEFTESEDYISDLHSLFYFRRRMLRMTFGGPKQGLPPIYHIFLSVGSQENIPAAAAARSKKGSPIH